MTDVVTFAGRQGQVNTTGVGAFVVAISAIFKCILLVPSGPFVT